VRKRKIEGKEGNKERERKREIEIERSEKKRD
jgi:hypothetical protein